jgi:RNA polymerase sigma-70 factor (ECF subfamily)
LSVFSAPRDFFPLLKYFFLSSEPALLCANFQLSMHSHTDNGIPTPRYPELLKCSDERLMGELQAGNADAFAVVFDRYHRLVLVTALRTLQDAAEAEDLTQTIFLEIYRTAARFDPVRGTLKMWVLQFAYNKSISRRNYLSVRHYYSKVRIEDVSDSDNVWNVLQRPASQETARLIAEALATLKEQQRQTIEMAFFQGLTLDDIAAQTGKTVSTVRHNYYRGLERLRSCITGDLGSNRKRAVAPLKEVSRAGA